MGVVRLNQGHHKQQHLSNMMWGTSVMFLRTIQKPSLIRLMSSSPLKTCLYDYHVKNGGKMVDFAGYIMPVQYTSLGISASHQHTRTNCSLFDVSHMLQTRVTGKDRVAFIEGITVADVEGLGQGHSTLTVFTTDQGGIVDDLIVTKAEDHLYVVSNAGCRHKDIPLMKRKAAQMLEAGLDVKLEMLEDRGLVALQGPTSPTCLQPLTDIPLSTMGFMTSTVGTVAGVPNCRVTRCGYTGEDGVEISVPESEVVNVVDAIMASEGSPALAGLGARDSLRLEAGLCLYGNDITEETSPIEGGLTWVIPKSRRVAERATYPGAAVILGHLKDGVTRRRVGLKSQGPPARGGTNILGPDGEVVGVVTSGCPSPSLGGNVAMGYVEKNVAKVGTKLQLQVRNKKVETTVTKMPFVPANYYHLK